ncbi:MAG TPA: hypothetical protein P5307_19670 [Pirellulaceae bacterium]|nr:hypothetical protein [Planctomycetales bacterium]MCB9939895.1 hypothetical protein [Planctomycetaceae bacterium]HRX81302.1 hypothetical protein [Pirellulaceae bacterium]
MVNIADELLLRLQCPVTRQPLLNAKPHVLDRANDLINERKLTNRSGETVEDGLEHGLIDQAGLWLYAIRDGIVCLLADEAIALNHIGIQQDEAKE